MPIHHIEHLKYSYAYNVWANRDVVVSLQALDGAPGRATSWTAHIIAAEWLWLGWLQRQDHGIPVWPTWPIKTCADQFDEVVPLWEAVICELTPETLSHQVEYTNSQGQSWTSTTDEIITHIILHGAYHRGQIASEMRVSGFEPQYTDYIHATRQKLVE